MKRTRPLISFDWAIKKILRQKSNHGILAGFLSELLRQDVSIQNILESESNRETETDKHNRVDILCENTKGELFLIELQYDREEDYFFRMNYGTAKAIAENLESGDSYAKLKKVFSVNILYFDLGQGKDYVYRGTNRFRGLHTGDYLRVSERQRKIYGKKYPHEFFPEYFIIRVNSFGDVTEDGLDEWIYYFKNNRLPSNYHAKGLGELDRKLREESMTADERLAYSIFLKNKSIAIGVMETARYDGQWEERERAKKIIDEALREKEEERKQKEEALKQKEEERKQKEEALKQKEEALKEKEKERKQRENLQRMEAEARLEIERLKKILSKNENG